ncbi:MAG: phage tail tape measure protein [Holosporaceae bacterium]|jgi:TP901 family phage tail tape measure protein|nr:phage tail tape measure protein [Holosporaceae bacterium]
MASETSHQLKIAIGAALSGSFGSVTSGATSKITKIGAAIKDMEKQGALSARTVNNLKMRYDSFLGSLNKQQAIIQKRAFYQSQIMGVVALGAALVAPVKAAMDFETSLSDIASVVNFPEPDGLEKLGDTLTEISLRVPMTADDLAKIAATGGAFGVALKDLPYFTEEVAKTTKAWRLTADESSEKVGNLMKTFNVTVRELPKHFDAINHLGNLTGAAAGNILRAITRSGDGLANFKLSIPQVAALTSTIMSFGEGAEQAGTLVSGMLQKLSIAKGLGKGAQKTLIDLGLSPNAIASLMKENPQKILDELFSRASKLSVDQRAVALQKIFGRGPSKVVGKLINNLELYKKNLQYVADPKNFEGSRDVDYEIVAKTTREKLTLLTNTISAFSKEIGRSLLPAIGSVADSITSILTPIMSWMAKNKELTKTITTGVAGLISFRIATFALGYASTFLFGGLNRLVIVAKGLRLGLSLLGVGIKTLLFGSFGKFMLAAGALGTVFSASLPEEAAGLANSLGVLGTQFRAVAAGSEGPVGGLKALWTQFRTVASGIGGYFVKAVEKVTGLKIQPVFEKLAAIFSDISSKAKVELSPAFNAFKDRLVAIAGAVTEIVSPSLVNLRNIFSGIVRDIRSGAIPVIEALRGVFAGFSAGEIGQVIAGVALLGFSFKTIAFRIIPAVFSVFSGLGKALWFFATTIIPTLYSGIAFIGQIFWFFATTVLPTIFNGFWYLSTEVIPAVWSGFSKLAVKLWEFSSSAITTVIGEVRRLAVSLWGLATNAVAPLIAKFPILGKVMRGVMMTGGILALAWAAYEIYNNWEKVKNFFGTIWVGIKGYWDSFAATVASLWENCVGFGKAIYAVFDFTKNLGSILYAVIENVNALINRFIFGKDVVIPAWESVKNFFKNIWNDISWDSFIKKIESLNVADKIMASWEKLKAFFTGIWDDIAPKWDAFTAPLSKIWNGAKSSVSSIGSLFKSDETKPSIASKLPPLSGAKAVPVTKNQNVSVAVNVNASKISDPREVAKQVSKEMKSFNWNYLYDPVGALP